MEGNQVDKDTDRESGADMAWDLSSWGRGGGVQAYFLETTPNPTP